MRDRDRDHYHSEVASVKRGAGVCDVADRMDEYAIGCVVVVDDEGAPIGIITDRDLMKRVVAARLDPDKTTAGDVMSGDLITGSPEVPLEQILEKMQTQKLRRIPIVSDGKLSGIVTHDDVVCELGREMSDLRDALRTEVLGARRHAHKRRRREEIDASMEEIRGQMRRIGSESVGWLERELESLRKRIGRD